MAEFAEVQNDILESPAKHAFSITPHVSNVVGTYIPRGIYVGVTGNITMRLVGDTADVVFIGVSAGSVLPVRPQYIRATGTAAGAGDILGLY